MFESVLFLARSQESSRHNTIGTTSFSSVMFSVAREITVLVLHTVLLALYCRFPPWMDVAAFWMTLEAAMCILRLPREPLQYILDRREIAVMLGTGPAGSTERTQRPSWRGVFLKYANVTFNLGLFVWVWGLMSLVTALIKDRAEGVEPHALLYVALAEVLAGPLMWLLLTILMGIKLLRIKLLDGEVDYSSGTYWMQVPTEVDDNGNEVERHPRANSRTGQLRRDLMAFPMMMVFGVSHLPQGQPPMTATASRMEHLTKTDLDSLPLFPFKSRRKGDSSQRRSQSPNECSRVSPLIPSSDTLASPPSLAKDTIDVASAKSNTSVIDSPKPLCTVMTRRVVAPGLGCPTNLSPITLGPDRLAPSSASARLSITSGASCGSFASEACSQLSSDTTCAICILSYAAGDLIRELACGHRFHKSCVDPWLLGKPRTAPGEGGGPVTRSIPGNRLCPICKQDAVLGVRKAVRRRRSGSRERSSKSRERRSPHSSSVLKVSFEEASRTSLSSSTTRQKMPRPVGIYGSSAAGVIGMHRCPSSSSMAPRRSGTFPDFIKAPSPDTTAAEGSQSLMCQHRFSEEGKDINTAAQLP
ncbi:hypothetical protein HDU67_003082 [Dinochytrium kinnereticum]|nr:hypothetical protein HDU67_003082 [Dinochytrium kinnereticum]